MNQQDDEIREDGAKEAPSKENSAQPLSLRLPTL